MRRHKGHFADVAEKYARDVIAGDVVVCRQIKLQCQRFIQDIEGDRWTYNANLVENACRFIQRLPHVKGKWASRRELLVLEPWQVWMTAGIVGMTDANHRRKHREAVVFIPRKNAKSTWAAALALYMLVADGEAGAEVLIGANSMDQADACFGPAKKMAERAAGFAEHWGAEVHARSVFLGDGSHLKPIIGKPGDGQSPSCAILDEAHENIDSSQYDTMKTGMGAREQPVLLTITTAGTNLAGPCRDLQLYAEQVLEGQVEDDALFAAIYTIDPEDDWTNFDVWKKANPNYGVSVADKYLQNQHAMALARPSKAADARTKHLNQWVSSSSAYVNMNDWAACGDAPPLAELEGRNLPAWVGLDLATKNDIAAMVLAVRDEGRLLFYPFLFLSEGAIDGSKNEAAYRQWADNGELIVTEGNALDFFVVEDKAKELMTKFAVRNVGFDPWQGNMLSQRLQNSGISVTEYGQSYANFHRPMDDLEAMLSDKRTAHPNNPAFNWMAGNLCAKYHGEFKRPEKPAGQSHLKIDGMVAALMALGLSIVDEDSGGPIEVWFVDL